MLAVIITIIIFGVIIFIHELGHFIVAKLSGVKVNEFALGMGPAIFSYQKKLTEEQKAEGIPNPYTKYSLRIFPIGGYVSMEGENDESDSEDAFYKKSLPKRFAIVAAGAVMNLILGLVILFVINIGNSYVPVNTIAVFDEQATSQESGLQIGDELIKIDGKRVYTDYDISTLMLMSSSSDIDFTVKRDGEIIEIEKVHFETVTESGTDYLDIDFKIGVKDNNILRTISYSFKEAVSLTRSVWLSLMQLITGRVSFTQLSGPVGVGEVVNNVVKIDFSRIYLLAALLTINVGIFNLLPLPALDGGRLFFMIIELIFRRPVPAKVEAGIHTVGLVLLMGLMVVITLKDIWGLLT